MEVKHCPKCGADDISENYWSAEYMSKSEYSCGNCSWYYSKGSGMGVGSGDDGVHPQKAARKDDSQRTLVETGVWCSTCDTCAKPDYCRCVKDGQTGFCKDCANYSKHDVSEMHEVKTYFGKYNRGNKFPCSICGEEKSELKVVVCSTDEETFVHYHGVGE